MSQNRSKDYKKGVDCDDSRRRREANLNVLRKEKKEEGLAKRRMLVNNFFPDSAASSSTDDGPKDATENRAVSIQDMPVLYQGLFSNDASVQLPSLRGFRRLLSAQDNPPVIQCIEMGVIPVFVEFLKRHDNPELQFEAAWALTNITSTDRTHVVVEYGAVPHLSVLLTSANPNIREQSAWCLGNIAGDGPALRDVVLNAGALPPLVACISQPSNISLLRNCTWALSNFCRGKPQPPLSVVAPALPVLASIIQQSNDQSTIVDATWALSYISDGDNNRIQAVIDYGTVPCLIQMLNSGKGAIMTPALRTLGNIVSGDDSQTQHVVNSNVLPALVPLLSNAKKNIRKETCWMLSNIAAGSQEQLTMLMNTNNLIPKVLEQLSPSAEWDVRKEACWVIANIATDGNNGHITKIIEYGAIRPLCDLLDVDDVRTVLITIDAIEAMLKSSTDIARLTQLIEEADGIDKFEALQGHQNTKVYEKAVNILEKYFGGEEEQSENIAPEIAPGSNSFSFGIQTTGNHKFDFGPQFMAQNYQHNLPSNAFQF